MAPAVSLLGSNEPQLIQMLRVLGLMPTVVPFENLESKHPTGSKGPDVFLVDIRDLQNLPREVSLLKRQFPGAGVVIVARTLDPAVMLEAMRSGVTEWVHEPLSAAELDAAIRRVAKPAGKAPAGKTFAIMGAKGGLGSTTVAVNLATALHKASRQPTLVMDLHLAHGDASVYFGVEPRFSVLDALENIHRLDETYFKGLVTSTKAGPDLLASSDRALMGTVDVQRVRHLIEFASTVYRYVVLDCPRSDGTVVEALDAASTVIVLANQELATLRNATRIAAALRQRCGTNRVKLAISRLDPSADISRQDVERVLGGPVKYTFPSDYRTSLGALNRGEPLILQNHSSLAFSFEEFARDVAELPAPPPETTARPGLLGRLSGRR
jgi:pilus assembly protein CpaE